MSIESISASFESLSLTLSLCVYVHLQQSDYYTRWCCVSLEWTQSARPIMQLYRGMNLYIFFLSSTVWFNRSRKSNWKKVIERATMKELQSRPPYIFIARKLQTNLHLSMECHINTIRMYLWMQTVHDQTQQYYFIIFQDMKLQCNCKMHK